MKSNDPILKWMHSQQASMVKMLESLVLVESPSTDKSAVDRLGKLLGKMLGDIGGQVRFYRSSKAGDILRADFLLGAPKSGKGILLIGHMDTVWSLGTLQKMPFRVNRGNAYGPGVLDMKSGIVMGIFALRALQELGKRTQKTVSFLLTSDEEIGSKTSRSLIEKLSRKSCAALVLEPAFGRRGALKTGRKGVGDFTLRVTGKSAHAGLEPEKGASAVSELCRQIGKLEALSNPSQGLTLNVGVIAGGTRSNVVPDGAFAKMDVRISRMQDMGDIEKSIRKLGSVDRRTKLQIEGGFNRPPMERNDVNLALFDSARVAGRKLGLRLTEASVGGASDGNFTSALGVPTLDGLGGVGEGAHALSEYVVIDEMPRRAVLLAHLISTL